MENYGCGMGVHAYVYLIQYFYEALLVRSRDKRQEVRIRESLR